MAGRSLRLRLTIAAVIAITLASALAGLLFYVQFQKHVERLMVKDFQEHYDELVSNLYFDDSGQLQIDNQPSDPRFTRQFGGSYWQIDMQDGRSLHSRSLWDSKLVVPTAASPRKPDQLLTIDGPDGKPLLSMQQVYTLEKSDGNTVPITVTIAEDYTALTNTLSAFTNEMWIGLALLYAALIAASLAQIFLGLQPLEGVRKALEAIRAGNQNRMMGNHPSELLPLVGEINSLLDARDRQLERARQRAGNLAHGLKTPLTVMDAVAGDLAQQGKDRESDEISETVREMRMLVDREMARSRLSANHKAAATALLPAVEKISSTLAKARRGTAIRWVFDFDKSTTVPMEFDDLMEILGNLMDNAQIHARSEIKISYAHRTLIIEDDGPGVPADKMSEIFKRGVRLDEKKPGSGLGLAIAQDIASAYGADIAAERSSLGGLRLLIKL